MDPKHPNAVRLTPQPHLSHQKSNGEGHSLPSERNQKSLLGCLCQYQLYFEREKICKKERLVAHKLTEKVNKSIKIDE